MSMLLYCVMNVTWWGQTGTQTAWSRLWCTNHQWGSVTYKRVYISLPYEFKTLSQGNFRRSSTPCHNINTYYMITCVSGQDEPNSVLWLATQVSKMDYLASSGSPAESHKNIVFFFRIIKLILCWPSLFCQDDWILALFFFLACLWTLSPSQSINT